ncbi:hypothetical protein AOE55_01550 [Candidatus Riesia pediculicola]|nr:hypothetical protein AOE55_01550 [Candidatus Riesia pediculicola]
MKFYKNHKIRSFKRDYKQSNKLINFHIIQKKEEMILVILKFEKIVYNRCVLFCDRVFSLEKMERCEIHTFICYTICFSL